MMIKKRIHALWNPILYHGWGRRKRFFEGWYYKVVSADEKSAFAFIPGIAMDAKGKKQAFVQVLDGKNLTASYHKFGADRFFARSEEHDILVGESRFTTEKIEIDLPNLKGTLSLNSLHPWPNSWYSPGIMGPFSFLPFMECYHGIGSMDHELSGTLSVNDAIINFDGGRGYLEKDWGKSFPKAYVWMQSNHFHKKGISVKASVAKIPYLGTSFTGFIAGVLIDGKLYQFTTYHFTRLKKCIITDHSVDLILENNTHKLTIKATRKPGTELIAPIAGFMDARVEESMDATLAVTLIDKKTGSLLLNDTGSSAGLEVAGDYPLLETR